VAAATAGGGVATCGNAGLVGSPARAPERVAVDGAVSVGVGLLSHAARRSRIRIVKLMVRNLVIITLL
jgi:hypothetical protein